MTIESRATATLRLRRIVFSIHERDIQPYHVHDIIHATEEWANGEPPFVSPSYGIQSDFERIVFALWQPKDLEPLSASSLCNLHALARAYDDERNAL